MQPTAHALPSSARSPVQIGPWQGNHAKASSWRQLQSGQGRAIREIRRVRPKQKKIHKAITRNSCNR